MTTATNATVRKPAPAEAEVHELIRERWSPRAFTAAPVPLEAQRSLLEAARWAPSSVNEQPWRFVIGDAARDAEAHARIESTLMPANAAWARHAPLLILVAAKTEFSRGGENRWATYDTGLAVAQLTLEATALGLSVHQMGGFDAAAAREHLGVPDGFAPIAVLAVGYAADAEQLPADLKARERAPRARKPVHELAHAGRWGRPWQGTAAVL